MWSIHSLGVCFHTVCLIQPLNINTTVNVIEKHAARLISNRVSFKHKNVNIYFQSKGHQHT